MSVPIGNAVIRTRSSAEDGTETHQESCNCEQSMLLNSICRAVLDVSPYDVVSLKQIRQERHQYNALVKQKGMPLFELGRPHM